MTLAAALSSFVSAFGFVGAITSAVCLTKNKVHSDVVELERVYAALYELEGGSDYVMKLRKIHYEQELEAIRFKEENKIYEEQGKFLGFIPYTYTDESEFISATPRVKEKISQITKPEKREERISLARRYHAGEVMFLDAIRNVVATDDTPNQYIREDDREFANTIYKFIDPRFGKVYSNDECGNIEDYDITLFPNVISFKDWTKTTIADKLAFTNMLDSIKEKAKFNVFIDNKLKAMGKIPGDPVHVTVKEVRDVFTAIRKEEKQLRDAFKIVDKIQLMKYNFLADARVGNSKVKEAFKSAEIPVVTNKEPDGPVDQKIEEFNWKNEIVPQEIQAKNETKIPQSTYNMVWATFNHYFGKDFDFIAGKNKEGSLMLHVEAKSNPACVAEYYIDDGTLVGGKRVAILVSTQNDLYKQIFIPVEKNSDIVYKILKNPNYRLTDAELDRVLLSSVTCNAFGCVDLSRDKQNRINNMTDSEFAQFLHNATNGAKFVSVKYNRNLRFRIDWETFSDINNFNLISDELIKPICIVDPSLGSVQFDGIKGFSCEVRNGKAKDQSTGIYNSYVEQPRSFQGFPLNNAQATNPLMNQWNQYMQNSNPINGMMRANQRYE